MLGSFFIGNLEIFWGDLITFTLATVIFLTWGLIAIAKEEKKQ